MAPRATWVWTRPDPEDLLSWVQAERVAHVFLGVGKDIGHSPEGVWARAVVELMHRHGVTVAALGGDLGWLTETCAALDWQRAVTAAQLFDGVHLDVEVWTHPQWTSQPRPLGAAYLRLLRRLVADGTLPIEADIGFHLNQVPGDSGASLEVDVMHVVDAVTVLSYRNTVTGPDSMTGVATSALASAAEAGISCRLAAETQNLGTDPVARKQTFYGLGKAALDQALAEVDRTLAEHHVYAGVAVHDYEHWRLLRRRWRARR